MKEAAVNVEEVTIYVLLQDFDGFLSYTEVFHPFRIYLCVWCKRMVEFHSFVYNCPIFPAPFIEETVFFPTGCFFLLCQRLVAHRAEGPFLGSLFFSLVYVTVFVPVPCCLCDHSFVVQLKIWHCDAPALFFLFNTSLAIRGLFWFHTY